MRRYFVVAAAVVLAIGMWGSAAVGVQDTNCREAQGGGDCADNEGQPGGGATQEIAEGDAGIFYDIGGNEVFVPNPSEGAAYGSDAEGSESLAGWHPGQSSSGSSQDAGSSAAPHSSPSGGESSAASAYAAAIGQNNGGGSPQRPIGGRAGDESVVVASGGGGGGGNSGARSDNGNRPPLPPLPGVEMLLKEACQTYAGLPVACAGDPMEVLSGAQIERTEGVKEEGILPIELEVTRLEGGKGAEVSFGEIVYAVADVQDLFRISTVEHMRRVQVILARPGAGFVRYLPDTADAGSLHNGVLQLRYLAEGEGSQVVASYQTMETPGMGGLHKHFTFEWSDTHGNRMIFAQVLPFLQATRNSSGRIDNNLLPPCNAPASASSSTQVMFDLECKQRSGFQPLRDQVESSRFGAWLTRVEDANGVGVNVAYELMAAEGKMSGWRQWIAGPEGDAATHRKAAFVEYAYGVVPGWGFLQAPRPSVLKNSIGESMTLRWEGLRKENAYRGEYLAKIERRGADGTAWTERSFVPVRAGELREAVNDAPCQVNLQAGAVCHAEDGAAFNFGLCTSGRSDPRLRFCSACAREQQCPSCAGQLMGQMSESAVCSQCLVDLRACQAQRASGTDPELMVGEQMFDGLGRLMTKQLRGQQYTKGEEPAIKAIKMKDGEGIATSRAGVQAVLRYDDQQRLIFSAIVPDGVELGQERRYHARKWEFDDAGRLTKRVHADGVSEEFVYDPLTDLSKKFRVTEARIVAADGKSKRKVLFTYEDTYNQIKTSTDERGTTTYTYGYEDRSLDTCGNPAALVRITDPFRHTVEMVHDSFGRVAQERDALGVVTSYEYAPVPLAACNAVLPRRAGLWKRAMEMISAVVGSAVQEASAQTKSVVVTSKVPAAPAAVSGTAAVAGKKVQTTTTTVVKAPVSTISQATAVSTAVSPAAAGAVASAAQLQSRMKSWTPVSQIGAASPLVTKACTALWGEDGNGSVNGSVPAGLLKRQIVDVGGTNQTTCFGYDLHGRINRVLLPTGLYASTKFDGHGWVSGIEGSLGQVRMERDGVGREIAHRAERRDLFEGGAVVTEVVSTFGYDVLGEMLESGVSGTPERVKYAYDLDGELIAEARPDGLGKVYESNKLGLPVQEKQCEMSENNRACARVIDEGPRLEYNTMGQLVGLRRADGWTERYSYDAYGRLFVVTDGQGRTFQRTYDALGQVTMVEGKDGPRLLSKVEYTYDTQGRVQMETLSLFRMGLRAVGSVPIGTQVTRYKYDEVNNDTDVRVELDGGTQSVRYDYDRLGRLLQLQRAGLGAVVNRYDAAGRLVGVEDTAMGTQQTLNYGLVGPNRSVDERGIATEYRWNSDGNLRAVRDGMGFVLQTSYDALRQVTQMAAAGSDPLVRMSVQRDASGRTTGIINGNLEAVEGYSYVADGADAGRLSSVSLAGGGRKDFGEYDVLGRASEVFDAKGNRFERSYDVLCGRLSEEKATAPDGRVWLRKMEYAADCQLVRARLVTPDGRGIEMNREVDTLGRVHKDEIRDDGGVTRVVAATYGPKGALAWLVAPSGYMTTYSYLGNGLPLKVEGQPAANAANAAQRKVSVEYLYDQQKPGWVTIVKYGNGLWANLQRWTGGQLQWWMVQRPSSGVAVAASARQRPVALQGAAALSGQSAGAAAVPAAGSGEELLMQRYMYDANGRMVGLQSRHGVTISEKLRPRSEYLELDWFGRLAGRFEVSGFDGVASNTAATGQLLASRKVQDQSEAQQFGYGADDSLEWEFVAGKGRMLQTEGGGRVKRIGDCPAGMSGVDCNGQAASGFVNYLYDENGDLISRDGGSERFEYDPFGHLIRYTNQRAGIEANYRYDGMGRRILREVVMGGKRTTQRSSWFGLQLIEQTQREEAVVSAGTGAVQSRSAIASAAVRAIVPLEKVTSFVTGSGIGEVLAADVNGQALYRIAGIGEAMWVDRSGQVAQLTLWNTWGEPENLAANGQAMAQPIAPQIAMGGREYDSESKLYYHLTRFYDPAQRRFTQADKFGASGGLNLRVAFADNPFQYLDATGTEPGRVWVPDSQLVDRMSKWDQMGLAWQEATEESPVAKVAGMAMMTTIPGMASAVMSAGVDVVLGTGNMEWSRSEKVTLGQAAIVQTVVQTAIGALAGAGGVPGARISRPLTVADVPGFGAKAVMAPPRGLGGAAVPAGSGTGGIGSVYSLSRRQGLIVEYEVQLKPIVKPYGRYTGPCGKMVIEWVNPSNGKPVYVPKPLEPDILPQRPQTIQPRYEPTYAEHDPRNDARMMPAISDSELADYIDARTPTQIMPISETVPNNLGNRVQSLGAVMQDWRVANEWGPM